MTLSIITKYSIVGAFRPIEEAVSPTISKCIWEGTKSTLVTFPPALGLLYAFGAVKPPPVKAMSTSDIVFWCPLIEELIFRVGVQGSLAVVQRGVQKVAPVSWKTKHTYKWLMSPSMRIVTGNSLFALAHLSNRSTIGLVGCVAQCAHILLFPNEAIVYETHGFVASFTAHASNNLIGCVLENLMKNKK